MSTLYISEFSRLIADATGKEVAAPDFNYLIAEQRVTISGTHAESAALNSMTRFVLIATDVVCSIAYGPAPAAVNTAHRLAANESRFYGATAPNLFSVISNT